MRSIDANIPTDKGIAKPRHWQDVVGAWLGIGTAPGALIIGAGMASRHGGAVPLLSFLISFVAMFTILWISGLVGIAPPTGEGLKLTELSPRYFGPWMQRILAALIAVGMIGWFGFNVGLGGAALSSLLHVPDFIGPLLIGITLLIFSLLGIHRWNGLAALTTIAVIILVVFIAVRYSAQTMPVTISVQNPLLMIVDIATFIGYVAVFSVRAPDFTAGFASRQDLFVSVSLLCTPVVLIAIAGIGLQQGSGSTDLVGVLSQSDKFAFGNLLVFLAVVAPSFTILYSGTPALRAAIGLNETVGMFVISAIGLGLAIARFDLFLIKWLGVLAALLPPLIVPMAAEAARRRRGKKPHRVSIWLWLPGAMVSVLMTIQNRPTAALFGLLISFMVTLIWLVIINRAKNNDGLT